MREGRAGEESELWHLVAVPLIVLRQEYSWRQINLFHRRRQINLFHRRPFIVFPYFLPNSLVTLQSARLFPT